MLGLLHKKVLVAKVKLLIHVVVHYVNIVKLSALKRNGVYCTNICIKCMINKMVFHWKKKKKPVWDLFS